MSYNLSLPTDLYEINMDSSDEGSLDIWDENKKDEQTGCVIHFRVVDGVPVARWVDFTRVPDFIDVDHLNGFLNPFFERVFTLHKKAINDAIEAELQLEDSRKDERF
jgi:hypothetical protein